MNSAIKKTIYGLVLLYTLFVSLEVALGNQVDITFVTRQKGQEIEVSEVKKSIRDAIEDLKASKDAGKLNFVIGVLQKMEMIIDKCPELSKKVKRMIAEIYYNLGDLYKGKITLSYLKFLALEMESCIVREVSLVSRDDTTFVTYQEEEEIDASEVKKSIRDAIEDLKASEDAEKLSFVISVLQKMEMIIDRYPELGKEVKRMIAEIYYNLGDLYKGKITLDNLKLHILEKMEAHIIELSDLPSSLWPGYHRDNLNESVTSI